MSGCYRSRRSKGLRSKKDLPNRTHLEFPCCPTKSCHSRAPVIALVKMQRLAHQIASPVRDPEPAQPNLRHLRSGYEGMMQLHSSSWRRGWVLTDAQPRIFPNYRRFECTENGH